MKDAYGGTFMLYLFMIFFVLYVSIIGVALNFAKVYRIKNNVINILEHNQYEFEGSNPDVNNKLTEYLISGHLYTKPSDPNFYIRHCNNGGKENADEALYGDFGICVIKKGTNANPYYNVKVYYVIDFPILDIVDIPIVASGETKVIAVKR